MQRRHALACLAAIMVSSLSAPARADNWSGVDSVWFRMVGGFGVGGMAVLDYEPMILFRDGTYMEAGDEALEDLDLAQSKRTSPARWGRWTKQGAAYAFTNARGQVTERRPGSGSFFPSFPAEAVGGKLAATYRRISGGGNSALGGDMTMVTQRTLAFAADGRLSDGSTFGAASGGAGTGVAVTQSNRQPPRQATYRIVRHTLTVTAPDGTTTRRFFAVGAKGTPPRPDPEMIFVGGNPYIVRK